MKSSTSSITFFTLLSTLSLSVAAGGIVANEALAATLQNAAVSFDGDYYITNVASGKSLYFQRDDSTHTTNLFTDTNAQPVSLQSANGAGFSGTVIAGVIGTSWKCMSAQWGFQQGQSQSDNAAVSYACQIGAHDESNGDLHVAKQLWQLVPVSSSVAHAGDSAGNELIAVSRKRPAASSQAVPAAHSHHSHSVRPCRHSATWLARHPEYVSKWGHGECAKRLASTKHGKRSLEKRDQTMYQILATDHITNMAIKAVGSSVIPTPGNYVSQGLEDYVQFGTPPASQLWYISSTPPSSK